MKCLHYQMCTVKCYERMHKGGLKKREEKLDTHNEIINKYNEQGKKKK